MKIYQDQSTHLTQDGRRKIIQSVEFAFPLISLIDAWLSAPLTTHSPPFLTCPLLSPLLCFFISFPSLSYSTARGKTAELRAELQASGDKKDKGFIKRKTVLKKIVANMTMGNDSTFSFGLPLFCPFELSLTSLEIILALRLIDRSRLGNALTANSVSPVSGYHSVYGHSSSRNQEEYVDRLCSSDLLYSSSFQCLLSPMLSWTI